MSRRKDLEFAVEELNNFIEIEDRIKVNLEATEESLIKGIEMIVELLETGDSITQKTLDIICDLEIDTPSDLKIIKEKSKKKKPNGREKNKFGFVVGSASQVASDLIMEGKVEDAIVSTIMADFKKEERIAKGRVKIIKRELKKRGFLNG